MLQVVLYDSPPAPFLPRQRLLPTTEGGLKPALRGLTIRLTYALAGF